MSEIIARNLQNLLNERGLEQKNLANAVGVSETTVSRWLNGEREPKGKIRKKVAEFFGINESELYVSTNEVIRTDRAIQKIPVLSWVSANRFSVVEDPFPPGIADEYHATTTKGVNMYALRVKMDCMEPEFMEGDIIVVRPDIQPENGDYVIVRDNKKNEATFKQLKKYGKTIVLHPLNPKYKDIVLDEEDRYQIVGVVVSKEKKYRK